MSPPPLSEALRSGPVVLDGGLATELERSGHVLDSALWSAALLDTAPEAIAAAHRRFLHAGARVLTTASYQATVEGFMAAGRCAQEAAELIRSSIRLARETIDRAGVADQAWVAASVSPFGAALADGSEYSGDYVHASWAAGGRHQLSLDDLRAFHRSRLEILASAAPDVIACETIPCLLEAEALLRELAPLGLPAWLSLTTVTGGDGVVRTRQGEPAEEVFRRAAEVDCVIAVGINCTMPEGLGVAVELAHRVTGKPVVVYPNSGESWDSLVRTWQGEATVDAEDLRRWIDAGARLVGGCCRVGPEQIARIAAVVSDLADR
jgi:homocysteine S-methyltransferase